MGATAEVLTLPRRAFDPLPLQASWAWAGLPAAEPVWLRRDQAESDERYLQLIPYLLLRDPLGSVWCYARRGGDGRLRDRLSCGVGGHIERADACDDMTATVTAALVREAAEELGPEVAASAAVSEPRAWIFEQISSIGRVHIGLLHVVIWTPEHTPRPREAALESLGFMAPDKILTEPRFEHWSHLAVGWLRDSTVGA